MVISSRLQNRFWLYALLILATALLVIVHASAIDYLRDFPIFPDAFIRGFQRGFMIGVFFWGVEIFILQGYLRWPLHQMPTLWSLVIKILVSTIVLVIALTLSRAMVSTRGHSWEMWLASGFIRDFGFSAIVTVAFHLVLQIRKIVGARVMMNLLLGRYHHPVRENRIFLFLDIADSTILSKKMGDTDVHKMISSFFYDIAEPISEFGGETHRYIGDEVVVTWPFQNAVRNARCLNCYFAICDKINSLEEKYIQDFDHVPKFRVGIHGGPVVAGECGDVKQEIVYFGDTVNTASRLEKSCRAMDQSLLVSGALLKETHLPDSLTAENLGGIVLGGHTEETEIFTIKRK